MYYIRLIRQPYIFGSNFSFTKGRGRGVYTFYRIFWGRFLKFGIKFGKIIVIFSRERFKERTGAEEDYTQRKSVLENEHIDFTSAGSVRERFQKGEIFQEQQHDRPISREDIRCADLSNFKERFEKGEFEEAPIGRTAVDVRCGELGNIRSNFEKTAIEVHKLIY